MSQFIVGVTSCLTGVAHTYIAAKALERAALKLGLEVKIETQGYGGTKNILSSEDIQRAAAVVIAADVGVDLERFNGKTVLQISTKAAINDPEGILEKSLCAELKKARSAQRTGPYRHLITGVFHMLPIVVSGGLLITLAFAVGGIYTGDQEGSLGWVLMQIGGNAAFPMFVPVFGAYIAYSIAGRVGLTPGIIGGALAANIGAGFIGAIVVGFLAGYTTIWLNDVIKLPDNLESLKPTLILPFLSSLAVGLLMMYILGPPVKWVLDALTSWLTRIQGSSAIALGLVLGLMMAFDMGGPVNKAAYTFSAGLLSSQIYEPMAATMAAGMTPPLGIALASFLFRNRFTTEEREVRMTALVLGICFITEGAIPYAFKDPLRVIPAIMIGSGAAGIISILGKVQLLVPHGGIFVLAIPNAVTNLLLYMVAIIAGTIISALLLGAFKKIDR